MNIKRAISFAQVLMRGRMKIETKYNLGEELWGASNTREVIYGDCPDCEKVAGVLLSDGSSIECPTCDIWGRGRLRVGYEDTYKVEFIGNVGKISTEHKKYTQDIRYMCVKTGINSGTLWPEEKVARSEAECQEICDRLNKE